MLMIAEIVFTFIALFLAVMIIHLILTSILKLGHLVEKYRIFYWSGLIGSVIVLGSIYISIG